MSRYTTNPVYKGSPLSPEAQAILADPEWFPHHYIISLVQRTDRRSKMIRKMAHAKLPYTLIDALIPTDKIIYDHYARNIPLNHRWGTNGSKCGTVIACMASHFKALKAFVASEQPIACIFEDDVILRIDYHERLRQLIAKYIATPTFPNLIMLSPGIDPSKDELYPNTATTWGALGYLISRSYAEHVLKTYDRPYIELLNIIRSDRINCILNKYGASSELIPQKSGGLVASIPLVIEQPNEISNLGNNIGLHFNMFNKFGYNNYVQNYP